jgi:chaperone required for assembly of F1-ATPase
MNNAYAAIPQDQAFAVTVKGKPLLTPKKKPLIVPTQALADAIITEWQVHQKFLISQMPMTALSYTAIDSISGQEEAIIEALMAYVDTDTLSYRATASEALSKRQQDEWDPILSWMSKRFGAIWQVTTGIMPLAQPDAMHQSVREYLSKLDSMQLSATCVMASVFSSLVLAIAVLEKEFDPERAFYLSRLEEEVQAEAWGRDEEAEQRKQRIQAEILGIGRFLYLLKQA